tara:strand:+ start:15529 stop:15789 length:261 start_codon:yes stop_codon:yes gene_type:complete
MLDIACPHCLQTDKITILGSGEVVRDEDGDIDPDTLNDVLFKINGMSREVSDWEATFIEDVIGNTEFTKNQAKAIMRMAERYGVKV